MEEATAHRTPAPDPVRWIAALPLGSLWLGLGIWAVFVALFVAWCALFGRLDLVWDPAEPLGLGRTARTEAVVGLLIAFLVVTRGRLSHRATEIWAPIQPLTHLSPERFRGFVDDTVRAADRRRLPLDLAGGLLGVAIVFLSSGPTESSLSSRWNPGLVWALGANALLFMIMARAAYASLLGRPTERIADAIAEVDLLDTRPLRCFGRQGLRIAFFWAGGSSIASLLAWNLDRVGPLVAILTGTIAMATLALLDPVRAVRRRIREAKQAELGRVRGRIRAAREGLLAGRDELGLPGLLAYEQRVEAVSEWPFDTSTLLRFGALALVATGSWLGGALVERLLDVALG